MLNHNQFLVSTEYLGMLLSPDQICMMLMSEKLLDFLSKLIVLFKHYVLNIFLTHFKHWQAYTCMSIHTIATFVPQTVHIHTIANYDMALFQYFCGFW